MKKVSHLQYTKWFRDFVDHIGLSNGNGKLGQRFCGRFGVDDDWLKWERDDRAAIINIYKYLR